MAISEKQKLFTKVTGLTFDVEKIPANKLAWYIPDGAMLDSTEGRKFQETQEFMEAAGIPVEGKVNADVETTINNDDPKKKPAGKGWKKVVDQAAVEAVEGVDEYWVLDGTQYAEDPTFSTLDVFEVISDEESWNASFANGVLKLYYAAHPSEDVWNNNENRACNFNDKIYTAKVYIDAAGEGEYVEKQFAAFWLSEEVQRITEIGGDENVYYIPMFYDIPTTMFEMFCNAPGGTVAKAADLADSSAHYIKIESIDFGGEGVGPAYAGWIANGAQTPWICVNFTDADANVKVIFRYDGNDVYPWNDKVFGNGEGHKAWGIASLPVECGGTDTSKLQIILEKQGVEYHEAVPAVEAVEEQYHWERTIVNE